MEKDINHAVQGSTSPEKLRSEMLQEFYASPQNGNSYICRVSTTVIEELGIDPALTIEEKDIDGFISYLDEIITYLNRK